MKFLADESIDLPVIRILRQHGFDVRSIVFFSPTRTDMLALENYVIGR